MNQFQRETPPNIDMPHLRVAAEQHYPHDESAVSEGGLLAEYPGLQVCIDVLDDLIEEDIPIPTAIDTAGKGFVLNRQQRRFNALEHGELFLRVAFAGARLLKDIDDPNTQYNYLYDAFISCTDKSPAVVAATELMTSTVIDLSDTFRNYENSSAEVAAQIVNKLQAEGISAEHTLLMELAGYTNNDVPAEGKSVSAAQAMRAVLLISAPSVPKQLREKLTTGYFDKMITRGVLHEIDRGVQSNSTAYYKISELIQFTAMFTGSKQDVELLDRLATNVGSWPKDQRLALGTIITDIGASYDRNFAVAKEAVSGRCIGSGDDSRAEFSSLVQGMFKQFGQRSQQPTTFTKAQIMKSRAAARKSSQPAAPEVVVIPMRKEPNKLVRLNNKDGTTIDQEDNRFLDLKDSYLGRMPSQVLVADLDNVLRYMEEQLDFSSGTTRGVQKFGNPLRTDGKAFDIFEFKPIAAPGLSIVSERGKKMRVLFALLQDRQLGIVTICDRQNMNNELRNLGFGNKGAK